MGVSSQARARATLRSSLTRWAVAGSGRLPKFVQVAAGAEGAALAAQLDVGDTRIGSRERQGVDELVTHLRIERVQSARAGQGDHQRRVAPVGAHPGTRVAIGPGGVGRPPGGILRPRLENRVGGRLRHQPVLDRAPGRATEQQGERPGRDRVVSQVLLDVGEGRVVFGRYDVAQLEPGLADGAAGHAEHDEGEAGQPLGRHAGRSGQGRVEHEPHRGVALERDVAAQLGDEFLGPEVFENRETLPCGDGRPPRAALGAQRRDGADWAARGAARAAGGTRRRRGASWAAVPRAGRARTAGRARRPHGPVAPGCDELRRELPHFAGGRRLDGGVAPPGRGHRDRSGVARARRCAGDDPGHLVGRRPVGGGA